MPIEVVPCLNDNYAYLIYNADDSPDSPAWLIDAPETKPIQLALKKIKRKLAGVLCTHHHWDHVNAIGELVGDPRVSLSPSIPVAAHHYDRDRIEGLNTTIDAPEEHYIETTLVILGQPVFARRIPGHTLGAIAWKWCDSSGEQHIFTGDTLFAAGCGRLFEGTPSQMFQSLRAITMLDEPSPATSILETRLWFGHEYTASNLRFAQTIEPNNTEIQQRLLAIEALGESPCTTPSTIRQELATNPFVRASSSDQLGTIRAAKDEF